VVPIKFYGGPNSSPSRYSVFDIDKFKTCLVNCNFCSYFYKIVLFVLILIGILSNFVLFTIAVYFFPNHMCPVFHLFYCLQFSNKFFQFL
jgi:hypothetical protein